LKDNAKLDLLNQKNKGKSKKKILKEDLTDGMDKEFSQSLLPKSLLVDNYTQIIDIKSKIEFYLNKQLKRDTKGTEEWYGKFDKLVKGFGSTLNMKIQILKL